jgi:phenylalanyl-tRNA synthetase beta chain
MRRWILAGYSTGLTAARMWWGCGHDTIYWQVNFEICRTSLLPGLFKTVESSGKHMALPLRLFEVSDVVTLDREAEVRRLCPPPTLRQPTDFGAPTAQQAPSGRVTHTAGGIGWQVDGTRVGSVNTRMMAALVLDTTDGFEIIHGLVDRIMLLFGLSGDDYEIKPGTDPVYFENRSAAGFVKGQFAGGFGVVHPTTLKAFNFDDKGPASCMELNVDVFLKLREQPE